MPSTISFDYFVCNLPFTRPPEGCHPPPHIPQPAEKRVMRTSFSETRGIAFRSGAELKKNLLKLDDPTRLLAGAARAGSSFDAGG